MTTIPQTAPDGGADARGLATPLDEIRALVTRDLPEMPPVAATGESLGDFAGLWRWLAAAQHAARPEIRHPRIALFAARHGAFAEKQQGLADSLAAFNAGTHPVAPLALESNADLKVYELDLETPSRDYRAEKALSEQEAAQALAYGMMSVQPGVDLLLLAAVNPVADLAAEEISRALKAKMDPFDALLRFGGFDIAAITGAIVAARLARMPVVLDGFAAETAAALLQALRPDAAAHARKASGILSEKTALPPPCAGALLVPLLRSLAKAA